MAFVELSPFAADYTGSLYWHFKAKLIKLDTFLLSLRFQPINLCKDLQSRQTNIQNGFSTLKIPLHDPYMHLQTRVNIVITQMQHC